MITDITKAVGIDELINLWLDDPENSSNITYRKKIPEKRAEFGEMPSGLGDNIRKALSKRGIEDLYSHQTESINLTLSGKNVVVVTPTASGKTLCYNLPVLNEFFNEGGSSLYLFPTKALAQDQLTELNRWQETLGTNLGAFTYDGDTSSGKRSQIRKSARILITNPDMLHLGILPHHTRWAAFFSNLKYVVIDEMHVYRGVFGSHFANLIRRLKRICDFYSASPQFICSSATIANPEELAENLIEDEVSLVDKSGAPASGKEVLFFNPPMINHELGIRANYLRVAKTVARFFLKNMIQTLVFATSRMNVEIILKYLRDDFAGIRDTDEFIKGYRGGYLSSVRREIEKGLREGTVTGVVATNALELGVDIGGLDACVIAGYPGSIASMWQQAGRVGRRSGNSIAVLVARSNPLDQFITNFPDYFFGRSPEHGRVNPDNPYILMDHIKCAAFELPMNVNEKFGNTNLDDIFSYLEDKGVLHQSGDLYHYTEENYPADSTRLRNIGSKNILIVDGSDGDRVLSEVDFDAAFRTVHENAVYMVEGRRYIVERLDLNEGKAFVNKTESDYFTVARTHSEVSVTASYDIAMYGPSPVEHGEIEVITETTGFKKVRFYTGENLGEEELDLPARTIKTTAYWFVIKEELTESLDFTRAEIIYGITGISNVLLHVASFILMCDVSDLGVSVGDRSTEWFVKRAAGELMIRKRGKSGEAIDPDSLKLFEPVIYIYDSHSGGVGFSPVLFREHSSLLTKAVRHIEKCECVDGCPSCVGPMTEIGNRGKEASKSILDALLPV